MFDDDEDDDLDTGASSAGFDDPEDLDVEDLEDEPDYNPDDEDLKNLKGG